MSLNRAERRILEQGLSPQERAKRAEARAVQRAYSREINEVRAAIERADLQTAAVSDFVWDFLRRRGEA